MSPVAPAAAGRFHWLELLVKKGKSPVEGLGGIHDLVSQQREEEQGSAAPAPLADGDEPVFAPMWVLSSPCPSTGALGQRSPPGWGGGEETGRFGGLKWPSFSCWVAAFIQFKAVRWKTASFSPDEEGRRGRRWDREQPGFPSATLPRMFYRRRGSVYIPALFSALK